MGSHSEIFSPTVSQTAPVPHNIYQTYGKTVLQRLYIKEYPTGIRKEWYFGV